jgi:hypothetical protein
MPKAETLGRSDCRRVDSKKRGGQRPPPSYNPPAQSLGRCVGGKR